MGFAKSRVMDMIDDFIARHKTEYQEYLKRHREKDSARLRALFSYNHKDYVKFEEAFYESSAQKEATPSAGES